VKDYDGDNLARIGIAGADGAKSAHQGDWPGGVVALHTPSSDVTPSQTSVLRWTAPRNMTVDAEGGMWRLLRSDFKDEDLLNLAGNNPQVNIVNGVATLSVGGTPRNWPGFAPDGTLTVGGQSFEVSAFGNNASELALVNGGANVGPVSDFLLTDDVNRDHEFELTLNGSSSLATGLIDNLNFDCAGGNNSVCPVRLDVNSITVSQGDTLDLLIRPVSGATPTFVGVDFTIVEAEIAMGLPGDYSDNGTVDAADYVLWRDNQGTNNVLPNDPIGGTIGASQYDQWRANFGSTGGTGAGTGSVVPEPGRMALLVLGALLVGEWRRRQGLITKVARSSRFGGVD
jgi:hypothetical protein